MHHPPKSFYPMKVAHIVALSGGHDSTVMALRLKELNPHIEYTYVCTPTGDELPEMVEHWVRLSEMLGCRILPIVHPRGLNGLVDDQSAIPNWRQRWCTRMLKIEPYAKWLHRTAKEYDKVYSYVGLRFDEPDREGGDYSEVEGVIMRFPLKDWEFGEREVQAYLKQRGVKVPERTDCARCFYQRLDEWYDLWKTHPDIWAHAEKQEETQGYTWRSPGRDAWPTALKDLAAEFERGRIPKNWLRRQQGRIDFDVDPISTMKCRVCRI